MTPRMFATISGIIFLLIALGHLLRVFAGFEFEVGGWNLPSWGSIVATIVAGYLSYAGLRIATRH